ncbi:MAG: hypothetical protein KAS04_03570 [Candidatus Aenigmarchaeota archaeon]|nr:hypothetical protein [Candidatus Aenigmarchaeota archaeon]
MQIPILKGIYSDESPNYRTSYPRNLIPVPESQGISKGFLRPADGIVEFGSGPGVDRGGVNWNETLYRVMGTKLGRVDSLGEFTEVGDVGGTNQVTMLYSFDYLAIASNNNLFLYDGTTLTQVTDEDLGTVLDVIWIDGYFMTTDGEFLIVTELGNPFAVNPLKYGSSEADPDPVVGLEKIKNEVYALNRYTIEVFDNIGGSGFPFQRLEGAQMSRGALGANSSSVFMEALAFLGSGRNETPAVWLGRNSTTLKISTREIDLILSEYSETQLSTVLVETKVDKNHHFLYLHLPDQTLAYDGTASKIAGDHVWFTLTSSIVEKKTYQAKNFIWCYDKWICGDPLSYRLGYLTDSISSHYGDTIGWDFGTTIIYNDSKGAIFHDIELISLSGRVALGENPTVWTKYSTDGETWSIEKPVSAKLQGERNKRLVWFQQGHMERQRIQRFRGTSDTHISIARLEANLEPLNV